MDTGNLDGTSTGDAEDQWPVFGEAEEKRLLEVFRSGKWWFGDCVREFEKNFADYHDARHAITCTNGTTALEITLRALGIGPGDEVIVPDYTFIATAGAVACLNAIPRFADVEEVSANIDWESAARLVNENTKAIIVVHFAGLPVDLDRARAFADEHGIKLIEDAAHAWGSRWNGRGVGTFGEAGTFSFQLTKNITAGEGGVILTNDDGLAEIVRSYTNCGRLPGGEWYEHNLIGGNNRMTEFQAAVLLGQLERLPSHVDIREANGTLLDVLLSEIPGIAVPRRHEKVTRRSYHLYVFHYSRDAFGGMSKQSFVEALNDEGITADVGYLWPVHANHCFQTLNDNPRPENAWLSNVCNSRGIRFDGINNPVAARISDESMVWLRHKVLLGSTNEMEKIADTIRKLQKSGPKTLRHIAG